MCNKDVYINNGGIDHLKERNKYIIDYSTYSKDKLLDEIEELIKEL